MTLRVSDITRLSEKLSADMYEQEETYVRACRAETYVRTEYQEERIEDFRHVQKAL